MDVPYIHTFKGKHNFPTAKSISSHIQSSSSSLESNFLILPTIRPSLFNPNRLSRNSRSAAIDWCTQASMSPTYRNGSCAWSSMGRGYPEGPPRVRAVIKDERTVAWRVSDRKVKASLHIEVCKLKNVEIYKNNQRHEFRSLSQTNHRFSQSFSHFKLKVPSNMTKLVWTESKEFVVALFQIRRRRGHNFQPSDKKKMMNIKIEYHAELTQLLLIHLHLP